MLLDYEMKTKIYFLTINIIDSPILIYLHGGYWQWGSVFSSSFMADNFTKKGITLVALGYNIAPACNFLLF